MYSPPQAPQAPVEFWWVSCVVDALRSVADIHCGAADMLRSAAVKLRGVANTATFTAFTSFLANFENFSVFSFSRGKKHFSQKALKKWSSIQKNKKYFFHYLGVGVWPQSDKNPSLLLFFIYSSLTHALSYTQILEMR